MYKMPFLYKNDVKAIFNSNNPGLLKPIHQGVNQETEKGKQLINVRVTDEALPTVRCGNREQWNEDIHRRRAKTHPELNVSHLGTVKDKHFNTFSLIEENRINIKIVKNSNK